MIDPVEASCKSVVDTIPHLICITNTKGKFVYFNQQWLSYTKATSNKELQRTWSDFFSSEDLELFKNYLDSSIKQKEPFETQVRILDHTSQEHRWFLCRFLPIFEDDAIIGWIGTFTDIHEHKRAEYIHAFMSEISKISSSSLDYKKTLPQIAQFSVPDFADWCAIDILENGVLSLVALAHKNPRKLAWAKKLRNRYPPERDENRNSSLMAMKSGKTMRITHITDELIRSFVKTEEQFKIMKKVGFASVIIAPIFLDQKAVGVLSFVSSESNRQFSKLDELVAEEIAGRISLSLQNTKLYKQVEHRDQQFQVLYDSNIIGVAYTNLKDNVIYDANDEFLRMIGFNRKELKKLKVKWDAITPAEYKTKDQQKVYELMTVGIATPWEKEYLSKNGSRTPVIIGAVLLDPSSTEVMTFILDISERKKIEQRKDEFIGIASHELKTPLTSIKGYIQILERVIQQMGDEKLNTYLQKTNDQVNRLNSLIIDLLDVSKIQAGKLLLDISEFKLSDMITDVIDVVTQTHTTHTVTCKGNCNVLVRGDRHRLEQVMHNLLSNAIKYSPKNKLVEVVCDVKPEAIVVSVTDFGIGIPNSEIPNLFRRFYRVPSISQSYSGLGIGLYISKEIIQRHGGKIWVESEEQKGTSFYFSIPTV